MTMLVGHQGFAASRFNWAALTRARKSERQSAAVFTEHTLQLGRAHQSAEMAFLLPLVRQARNTFVATANPLGTIVPHSFLPLYLLVSFILGVA